eukprot:TRINITY_DN5376_c0_g1_i1.p1 TRINITY_DN5376_c0_g1~~TRINITY_DN5376_c0_g1_i1.p1  ORF type:complete len:451 (+),score=118.48 TRINITY_DN5376_c0_g1_i1:71-1423(+)
MGKAEREKRGGVRHNPLEDDIRDEEDTQKRKEVRPVARKKSREEGKQKREEKLRGEEEVVPQQISKKILKVAKQQQKELERENRAIDFVTSGSSAKTSSKVVEPEEDADQDWEEFEEGVIDEEEDLNEDEYYRRQPDFDQHLSAADEQALEMFMSNKSAQRVSLADLIMEKIREKEMQRGDESEVQESKRAGLNPKVIEVYTGVAQLLRTYRSGKVPKAFKIIPALTNWEEILLLTRPDEWSSAATFQATRLFASNLNNKMAQRFYNMILLPKVRDDIAEHKRLNYHLYMAVKKAVFKPSAFFKGFLLPVCEAGDCTLREAVILSSILRKVTIPLLQSSVGLLKLCEMEYSGSNSIFIRVLLDKKYALPHRVIESLVQHFARFESEERVLPVIWHQCFLVFAQRYREDITWEQKEALKGVLRNQYHPAITDEIRRELFGARRDDNPGMAD